MGLVIAPDPILLKKSLTVKEVTPSVKRIAEEMISFMDEHSSDADKPIGLSACQLGYSFRMIALYRNPYFINKDDIVVLINPILTKAVKQHIVTESCLSLPDRFYQVKRSKIVKIQGMTLDGITHTFSGRDLMAQVFQHELEHLDGILLDKSGKRVIR